VARSAGIDRSDLIDLSMSMNPYAPDVAVVLADHLGAISDYPDPSRAELALAAAIGVDPARLVLTNGGAEAIALVAALNPVGRVDAPEFSLYRRHLTTLDDAAPRWQSNPSNPLGKLRPTPLTTRSEPSVWDEAFYPLATGQWTTALLDDQPVWRLGSLTKLWNCPGLRIGYVIAPDVESADRLRHLQPRWSVNALALAVIAPLLELTDLAGWSAKIAALRARFVAALRGAGYTVVDTDVNWVLLDNVAQLRPTLVRCGVLIRDCSSFGLPDTARVALPRPDEFDRVIAAFQQVQQVQQ
jgi:histidinol-phosphate/aromatic aminotransferase/cobyric acid decarboxylase-like protein